MQLANTCSIEALPLLTITAVARHYHMYHLQPGFALVPAHPKLCVVMVTSDDPEET